MPVTHNSLSSVPLDPYLDWAIRNDFRHQPPGDWVPMLVEFDPRGGEPRDTALENFTRLDWLGPDLKKSVRASGLFVEPPRAIARQKTFNFCVLYVEKQAAGAVTSSAGWRNRILRSSFSPPFDPPAARMVAGGSERPRISLVSRIAQWFRRSSRVPAIAARQGGMVAPFGRSLSSVTGAPHPPVPQGRTTGPNASSPAMTLPRPVAVAVLDEGIAFAHERFRSATAPRIRYLWNQNDMVGPPPGGAVYGTEITGSKIEGEFALHSAGPDGEEAIYRKIGGLDYSQPGYKAIARRKSHGLHVASIATKVQPSVAADKRPIIAVELPTIAIADPTGCDLYSYIADGLFYAMKRVELDLSAGGMPLVCNISYGPHTGPHDGTEIFERFVDAIIDLCSAWPLEVVLAAGNFRQARVHAAFKVAVGRPKTLHWRLKPDDQLPSFVEFWCPTSAIETNAVTVAVTSPLGVTCSVSLLQPEDHEQGPLGPVFWMWIAPWDTTAPPKRVRILVGVQPTASDPPLDRTKPLAPSGLWTITVSSTANVKIEAWIGRKIESSGRSPRGRQSYFDDPSYVRFERNTMPREYDLGIRRSYVSRQGTLSGIATGARTHVIGSHLRPTWAPTFYTSMAPLSGGLRAESDPNFTAVGDDSGVLRGVLGAGTRSGSVAAMSGTSVAAPQFTHWLAEELATKVVFPPYAPPLKPPRPGTPPEVFGKGCLDYPTAWYRTWRADRPTL